MGNVHRYLQMKSITILLLFALLRTGFPAEVRQGPMAGWPGPCDELGELDCYGCHQGVLCSWYGKGMSTCQPLGDCPPPTPAPPPTTTTTKAGPVPPSSHEDPCLGRGFLDCTGCHQGTFCDWYGAGAATCQ